MLQVGEKDLSNNVCEYEVNRLTNAKVIRGKLNFNAAARVSPIYKPKLLFLNPAKYYWASTCV